MQLLFIAPQSTYVQNGNEGIDNTEKAQKGVKHVSHKIAIIAPYAGLSDAAQQVCSELEAEAEIVVGDLDEGVKAARKLIDQGVEVIISRGGTATAITNNSTSLW